MADTARFDAYNARRTPPTFADPHDARVHVKRRLAVGLRVFAAMGYDEGLAGHITARDPIDPSTFWVNPFTMDFSLIRASDLIRVDHDGIVIDGDWPVNKAAFAIHASIHHARPDVGAAAHAHSVHGKAFSALARPLAPISQDACQFYEDHAVFDDYTGVVLDLHEGERIAETLAGHKAAILRNHGLLSVGASVDAAVWWFIALDRCCHAELLATAAGDSVTIDHATAKATRAEIGTERMGWLNFQPLYDRIVAREPDVLD